MASQSEIANLAAVRIGTQARITTLDDDRPVARALKAVWDAERQATLRDGSYNFATRIGVMLPARDADQFPPPHPWGYSFQLPADCLRLLEVQEANARSNYELSERVIACNSPGPLPIRFIADVPELALWDASAAHALALRLAWRCGRRIAGSAFDAQACWREYLDAIASAKRVDARENPPIPFDDDSWTVARITGRWS